ncbi:MAG: type II CRISPR-associated endonuclease Cas1 [Eubacteriales bacterium]|nr:type II CRISPR-associated endonuclease Cas1 [Eubacteriales bacterium]MDY5344818.1 type II CRISPR-associated endonuclease Cas1 [Eubacteriales bacterium]
MSFRTVVVTKRCKLEYKLGYMVCRGEETKKIYLPEISTLMVESTAVSMTAALLAELIKNKVNVVFCDEKHNPLSQLVSLQGRYNSSGKLKNQLEWKDSVKARVWTKIVEYKILNQTKFLFDLKLNEYKKLEDYARQLTSNDLTNREGHAAKVYFDALFGLEFKRGDDTFINSALNYGYAILLSAFNREIVAQGYSTQLGLNHKNEFNFFNLACDLIEPFRPIVDRFVFDMNGDNFDAEYKHKLCEIFLTSLKINKITYCLSDGISLFVRGVFNALETGDISTIYNYEL